MTGIGAKPQDVSGDPAADWDFFAPLPTLLDDLDYFSLDPAGDVPVDGSLGGFFFLSKTDPASLTGTGMAVEAIGADSAAQIPLDNAKRIPEPATLLLLAAALAAAGATQVRIGRACRRNA